MRERESDLWFSCLVLGWAKMCYCSILGWIDKWLGCARSKPYSPFLKMSETQHLHTFFDLSKPFSSIQLGQKLVFKIVF